MECGGVELGSRIEKDNTDFTDRRLKDWKDFADRITLVRMLVGRQDSLYIEFTLIQTES